MDKAYFSVLAIGKDSPGIVATVSGVLVQRHSCNVETSQMTIVSGHFVVALIGSSDSPLDHAELAKDLEEVGDKSGVRRVAVSELENFKPVRSPDPALSIIAQVTDRAGVLHEIAKALAAHKVNITSLSSVCSDEDATVCTIDLDVALPEGMNREDLEQILFEETAKDITYIYEEVFRQVPR